MSDRTKMELTEAMSKEDAAEFDAFARGCARAAYQQSRAWAENAPPKRRQDWLYFLCREGGETIGTAVVRRSRLGPGAALATVQRGPLVADPVKLPIVLAGLKAELQRAGCCTVVVGPRFTGDERDDVARMLADSDFRQLPTTDQALHVRTGKIALAGTQEEIFARFRQRGRRWIRKLEASDLTVRDADAADLPRCQVLLDDFHARRPSYNASGQPDVAGQARLVAAEGGALLIAEQAGRIVGYHSFVRQARDAIWLAMATDDDPKAPRSYLLVWKSVLRARSMGLTACDLAGLSAESESGRDQFKQAFAPKPEELLPAHVAALQPFRHVLFFNARQIYRSLRRRLR
jgi:lipid II:glycine glycyltransferase (peptidoglycan interpeptide bridge formation enzyme)